MGFVCLPSKANFLFAKHSTIPAVKIFEALKKEGIYVRYFNAPRINEYLRITIGTDEEMNKVIEFLKGFVL
jgi:histidinol-phosphate aminotransferase